MEEKEGKTTLSKEELKLRAQEMKLEEKQRRAQEKAEIRAEKERIKNSFGRKVRNFFLTIILVIILLVVGFYFAKEYLTKKERELTNEKMAQTYQNALLIINEKDYAKAIELLKSITTEYDNYAEANKKLKEVEQLYLNEYLLDANEYLKEEKFDKALDVLNGVEKEFQDAEVIKEKKSEIHITRIDLEIAELKNEKDLIEILEYLNNYDTNSLVEVQDEVEDLIAECKDEFILEARELMKKDYYSAKEKIDKVEQLFPEDKDIKKIVEELKNLEPVSLVSLTPDLKDGKLTIYTNSKNKVKDIEGEGYSDYILSLNSNENDSNIVEYKLDKKYSKLTGKICILQSSKDDVPIGTPVVKIYNDDQVIYTTEEISVTKGNIDFSIDVSDVETLKVEIVGNVNLSYFVANPILTKK